MIAQFVAALSTSAGDRYKCPELWYSGARCHAPTQRAVTPGFRPREVFARTGVDHLHSDMGNRYLDRQVRVGHGPT
jgi:hypothetical protein